MQEKTDKNFKGMQLMVLVFALLNACFLILKGAMTSAGLEIYVLLIANLVLFLVGFFTLRNGLKSIQNPNPHVFVRVFYSGFLIRLLACGTAAFVYIYMNNGQVSKRTLFACMGIYMAYSAIKVATLQKALKENKNA